MNWQPIETAPKDTVVLLYSPDRGPGNESKIEARVFWDTRGGHQHAWATHWMPLPVPPAMDTQNAKS